MKAYKMIPTKLKKSWALFPLQ